MLAFLNTQRCLCDSLMKWHNLFTIKKFGATMNDGLPLNLPVSTLPTQKGPHGILYDFNDGCRIFLPTGKWRLQLRDLETHTVLYDALLEGGIFNSTKRYHIRFALEIWLDGKSVFCHDFDATNRKVFIQIELGGIGDHFAWFAHAAKFQELHNCQLTIRLRPVLVDLFRDAYPHIRLITTSDTDEHIYYATYKICIFYNDYENTYQSCDYRLVGLLHSASYILGLPAEERKPNIVLPPVPRPIEERYVCIAAQASGHSKYWNNPSGWGEIIKFLKSNGYRVICIDLQGPNDPDLRVAQNLEGIEDESGNRPLSERANWIRHAEFFIGLSSGLSWLAWAVGTPVVMISGFTHPINEFKTPYRVINWNVCNSCSNDIRLLLDPSDFLWCPRLKNTERMFECTKQIMGQQVKDVISRIPGFYKKI